MPNNFSLPYNGAGCCRCPDRMQLYHIRTWRTLLKINYDISDLKITGKPVKPVKPAKNSM